MSRAPRTQRPFTVWALSRMWRSWNIESTWGDRDRALLRAQTLIDDGTAFSTKVVEETTIWDSERPL